ncbi:MAG: bifunctional folylpolyglutamate synthase/dihydrofolate synthase [Myxococcales bacterium]|nr:bifunctional folylpolyglutamate synthase/dihydrofolate synthase [Myxococcales bacterium]
MDIRSATAFLYALKPRGIRFGLEATRHTLERLGHPERTLQVIHVAGSKGKGSTCAFLDAVLRAAGHRVGFFSSPHLQHFRERFRIDGEPVSDSAIERAMPRLLQDGLGLDPAEVERFVQGEDLVRRMHGPGWYTERGAASRWTTLTFFECTTVLALLLFAEAGVRFAVMETGMGGRLDATNVLSPEVCVITPIQLEHTRWLGDTLEKIATEKAGIIKPGVPVISARQAPEAAAVIAATAERQQAPLWMMGRDFFAEGDFQRASFVAGGPRVGPLRLPLVGAHQVENAACAVACVPWLRRTGAIIPDSAVAQGLTQARWPGRFERFGPNGLIILDGAHTPDSAVALARCFREVFGPRRTRLLLGMLADKEAAGIVAPLAPLACEIHLTRPADVRGRDPSTLRSLAGPDARVHVSVPSAMEALATDTASPLLVTGSLTVVGEARAWLLARGVLPTES